MGYYIHISDWIVVKERCRCIIWCRCKPRWKVIRTITRKGRGTKVKEPYVGSFVHRGPMAVEIFDSVEAAQTVADQLNKLIQRG